jgi:hypothetical protein
VRTALSLHFPANREFNREILKFWPSFAQGAARHTAQFTSLSQQQWTIEAQKDQGIFLGQQGIKVPCYDFEQRKFVNFSIALSLKTPRIPTTS